MTGGEEKTAAGGGNGVLNDDKSHTWALIRVVNSL